jgi:hypothetical protein
VTTRKFYRLFARIPAGFANHKEFAIERQLFNRAQATRYGVARYSISNAQHRRYTRIENEKAREIPWPFVGQTFLSVGLTTEGSS